MTLDEAIRREFLIAANEIREYDGDNEEIRLSALYHKQLAEWLKELKSYREHNSIPASSENRVKLEHIECEDAVSRTDVFNAIRGEERGGYVDEPLEYMLKVMSNLPSVVPKAADRIKQLPSAQPEWNNHTVACLLAELFDDTCACNYNGIDEWLPEKCEVIDACPNPVGVACWEQYLKHREERRTDNANVGT